MLFISQSCQVHRIYYKIEDLPATFLIMRSPSITLIAVTITALHLSNVVAMPPDAPVC